jgi:hypothetical protein
MTGPCLPPQASGSIPSRAFGPRAEEMARMGPGVDHRSNSWSRAPKRETPTISRPILWSIFKDVFFFRPTILSTQKHIYTELLFTHFTDWWFQPIWTVVVIWDHHPKWGRKFSTHVKHSKPPSKVILTYTSLIYAHDIPFFALVTLPS